MNIYKNQTPVPYQMVRTKMFDVNDKRNPLNQEIKKCVGTYNFTATFAEDTQTLEMFKHVPGLIAFTCTLKRDNKVVGFGRGSAVLSKMSRLVDRTVSNSINSSFIDCVAKSAKIIDVFQPKINSGPQNTSVSIEDAHKEAYGFEEITDRQKSYLEELISLKVEDKAEREQLMSQLYGFTKSEASEMIKTLKE